MFPLFLNLNDRLCLVVGGGKVGRRRATALLQAGARVRLVCLVPLVKLEAPHQPEWLQAPYHPDHLSGAELAFAAATGPVNRQVAADARQRGIWVNVADDPEGSDFHVPAMIRRGDLLLAIGTGGAAPTLTRLIRERLEREFDDAFGQWVGLLAELRPLVLKINDSAKREALFAELTRWAWLERLRDEEFDQVRQAMLTEIQTVLDL